MGLLTAFGSAAMAGAGALLLYEHYAGENPILDTVYDLRLRRLDLDALDRFSVTNRRRSDVIVSLTTVPSRVERLPLTLKSLLAQRMSPSAIRLHVPPVSRREGRPYEIPAELRRLRSVTIVPTDDYGPATKLIPALLDLPGDRRILVVDDDRIYHRRFVEQMTALSDAHPGMAVAASGWDAPADLTDRPTTLMATLLGRPPAPIKCTRVRRRKEVDVMQGFAGYLVRPRFFDLRAVSDYGCAPEAAFFVDDVWISAHCRVPKVVFHGRRTNFPSIFDARFFKRSSVALVNRGTGVPDSRNNTIMLRYFQDRWRGHKRVRP